MAGLPVSLSLSGVQPTPPADLQAQLLVSVSSVVPGYTAELPAVLIEDVSSTVVGAIVMCNSAVIESLNSISPFSANAFLLNQLGQVYGVPKGAPSATSVGVIITAINSSGGLQAGVVIGKGFIVSDGNFQYALQDGGSTGTSGQTGILIAIATQPGTWAVPPGTVTQIVSSPPPNVTLTVVNPQSGIPGTGAETETSYRARVLQAGLAATSGMRSMLGVALGNVDGVQPRLISAIPQSGGGWAIIVGGGDEQEVAYAIYNSIFDISTLVGSTIHVTGITNTDPGVVTTDLTHQLEQGQAFQIAGASPNGYNGSYAALAIPSSTQVTLGKAFGSNVLTNATWSSSGGGKATYTTTSAHGVTVGSTVIISGCTPSGYNGTFVAITGTTGSTIVVAQPTTLTTPASVFGTLHAGIALFDTTGISPWVSGGVITPNSRNVSVTIIDYPDTYVIPYIVPPQQTVTMTATWNTNSPNFVSSAAVSQLAVPAIVGYINSIPVGKPINVFELQAVFQQAVAQVLSPIFLTRLVFSVSIDGVGVAPSAGTGIIQGDVQSFLFALDSGINVVQG